jgi:DNA polymerase-3 subunit gamma/tau
VVIALYRRYRPETFAEMIGQSQVTEPLMTALRTNRVNHAYLFSGPRGCGKTTSARILARCLNCAQGPTDTPCGTCPSCVELGRGGQGSLDVVEIDAASHNGVDDARDIRERAVFAPARDRYKIFILDEAHMVTPQGFNALLKIVEEPPEHVKFIFATTEPEKVIGTIRSRTHHYPFRLVPPAQMLDYVQRLCDQEGISVAPGVMPLVVRAGGGSPRDTLSLLDQLMAGSENETIEYERAVALLGYTPAELLDEVVDALAAVDAAAAFGAVDRVIQTGQDPRRFVEDLLEALRDLIVVDATSVERAAAVLRGIPEDELTRRAQQAAAFGSAELSRCADIVNAALTEMTGATSPRLHLELMVARMLVGATSGDRALAAPEEKTPRSTARTEAPAPTFARPDSAPVDDVRAQPGHHAPARPEPAPVASVFGSGPAIAQAAEFAARAAAKKSAEPTRRPSSDPKASDWATPGVTDGGSAPAQPAEPPVTPRAEDPTPVEPAAAPMPSGPSSAPRVDAPTAPRADAPGTQQPAGPEAPPAQEQPVQSVPERPVSPVSERSVSSAPEASLAEDSPDRAPSTVGEVAPVTAEQLVEAWPDVLDAVGERSAPAVAVVALATVRGLDGDVLALAFPDPNDVTAFRGRPGLDSPAEALRAVIDEAFGVRVKFLARAAEPREPAPAAAPRDDDPAPVAHPEANRLEVSRPEVRHPEASRPEARQPEAHRSAAAPAGRLEVPGPPQQEPPAQQERSAVRSSTVSKPTAGTASVGWDVVAIPVDEPDADQPAVDGPRIDGPKAGGPRADRPGLHEPSAEASGSAAVPPSAAGPSSTATKSVADEAMIGDATSIAAAGPMIDPAPDTDGWYQGPPDDEPEEPRVPDAYDAAPSAPALTPAPPESAPGPREPEAPAPVPASARSQPGTREGRTSGRPVANVGFQAPQRYGEAVVRELLGATFVEEQQLDEPGQTSGIAR